MNTAVADIVSPLRSAKMVAKDEGVSSTTIWRRIKAGQLKQVNVNGRSFITTESLQEFYRRAAAGEFAQAFHGACKPKKK